ncbi:MAG: hypothetical protein U9O64_06140 [Campylobacterota bacterium]|nr:hypothetical protein [Campylobacterota bacterium]
MQNPVRKRETFYLAGYDPRGARQYYNLYKKEAALQEKVNAMHMDISARKRSDAHMQSWQIRSSSTINNNLYTTQTNYHHLEWDDLIRKVWKKNMLSLFKDLFYVLKHYVFTGIIFKYAKTAPTQMIAAFYPVLYLFTALYLSYILFSFFFTFLSLYFHGLLSLCISLVSAYALMRFFLFLGNKMAVFWLLRIYLFALKYVYEEDSALEERLEAFATYIRNTLLASEKNAVDEVLIVSHSVGTIIAIPIMAKVLQAGVSKEALSKVSIMTLGECIPIVSFLPDADTYQEQMLTLASEDSLCWLDYTSAIDGACFPLMDFYQHSGIEIEKYQKPFYLSPRFHTLFSMEHYAALRKNRYLTHFIYLHATDYAGVYDFFKMTAGHQRLCSYMGEN